MLSCVPKRGGKKGAIIDPAEKTAADKLSEYQQLLYSLRYISRVYEHVQGVRERELTLKTVEEHMQTQTFLFFTLPPSQIPPKVPPAPLLPSFCFSVGLKRTFPPKGSGVMHLHVKCEPADIPRQP